MAKRNREHDYPPNFPEGFGHHLGHLRQVGNLRKANPGWEWGTDRFEQLAAGVIPAQPDAERIREAHAKGELIEQAQAVTRMTRSAKRRNRRSSGR